MSMDALLVSIAQKQAPVVVGLDPMLSYVPRYIRDAAYAEFGESLEGAAAAILEFNKGIIDAICDIVPAVKPQYAYYEQYGWQGMAALQETIAYAKKNGMYVIADAKRNDIGSTMQAYTNAHLGTVLVGTQTLPVFDADALTVNGYLGTDGIQPLLDVCRALDKGIFVLCKTSNLSSGEVQDVTHKGKPVYAIMGELCERWGAPLMGKYSYSAVGAVVGATYPKQLKELRAAMPHTMFLVPGYGAQGGKAQDIALAFDEKGRGAIVNSSRAVLCAYQKSAQWSEAQYAQAAREEAKRMIQELRSYIPRITL